MAWTTPKTDWATGELVTAADMNTVGENFAALKQPATAVYATTEDITASDSEVFEDVDTTNLMLTLTTTGGDVLVHFHGSVSQLDNSWFAFDVVVDEQRQGGNDGILLNRHVDVSGAHIATHAVSISRLIQGLSAGTHTFALQWKGNYRNANTDGTLHSGAQFWVREI